MAGPSGSHPPVDASELQLADEKFELGIACIKSNELENAIQLFEEVLKTRAKHYGELAVECASAYYRYGSVLLYQAQDSADVFGANMDPDNAPQDEDKENDERGGDDRAPGAQSDGDDDKGKEQVAEDDETNAPGVNSTTGVEGDLQLAWENLDTARAIWAKNATAHHAELATTHMLLGDVAMENGTFEAAVADYDACLEHYKGANVTEDDRRIAEVQFKRCCSLQFLDRIDEAMKAVQQAIAVLERRKEAALSSEDEKTAAELKDMDEVLEELKEKVEELKSASEEAEATRNALRGAMQQIGNAMAAAGGGQTAVEGGGGSGFGESKEKSTVAAAVAATGTSPVKDLGVVGRGTKRITLAPASIAAAPGEENKVLSSDAAGAHEPAEKKKRSLKDLMGGENATVGF